MKVLIIADSCRWSSWPEKIAAIKAFYAPLVELDIDIYYSEFENIPLKSYPGTVTEFGPSGATDVQGLDIEIDQAWFAANVSPLATGYDIVVFQTTNAASTGLPLGVKFGEINGTWCCETFVTMETASYYLPGTETAMGPDLGDLATIIIEHEVSHALYSISGQTDNTHLYFYANQFAHVLTDIKLPNQSVIAGLYQQVIADLREELGIIRAQKSQADMNIITPPLTPTPAPATFPATITKWAAAIAIGEGANPTLHNPGNLKYSTLTASWGAKKGPTASDGGNLCQFADDNAGQTALCNFLVLGCEDELIAFHAPAARTLQGFTEIYAGNPPQGYIDRIVETLGVPADTQISTFLS